MEEIKEMLEDQLLNEMIERDFQNKIKGVYISPNEREQVLLITLGTESIIYDLAKDCLIVYSNFTVVDNKVNFKSGTEFLSVRSEEVGTYSKYKIDEVIKEFLVCLGLEMEEEDE